MENNKEYANALEEKRKRYAKFENDEAKIRYGLLCDQYKVVYGHENYSDELVALWAMFFDACHIPYVAKPEIVKCPVGDPFQFDFFLPWFKTYVKVVSVKTITEEYNYYREKLEDVFDSKGNVGVMICKGEPFNDDMKALAIRENDGGAGLEWLDVFFLRGLYGYRAYGNDGCSWEDGKNVVRLCSLEWNAHTKIYHTSDWSSDLYCPVDYKDAYARQNFRKAKEYVHDVLWLSEKEILSQEDLLKTDTELW